MIKLFYSGSSTFNTSQNLASKSLGGYISNTSVPNGVDNSLFSSLSLYEMYKDKKIIECIGLGLYLFFFEGETSYNKINLLFDLIYNEDNEEEAEYFKDLFDFQLGLAPVSGDSSNGYYLETITSGAIPYYLTHDFQKIKFGEQIKFENVEMSDKGIGLWIKRIFDSKKAKEIFGLKSDYWIDNCKMPNLNFMFNLKIGFEGIE